ncbi:MAG TPA: transglutaminaseTgpA domain-containing protein [Phycisphaerales bacterium]|nr:transglutaminaseTgpA domain-containing protein [Phycisphaerales bacterium]
MNLNVMYRRSLHAVVLLGILAHAAANEDATYLVAALPFILVSLLLSSRGKSRNSPARPSGDIVMPRWASGLLLLGATAHMAYSWAGSIEDTIGVLSRYVIVLQVIKLFDCPTARDRAQLIGLSMMLVIASMLTSVTMVMGLLLLVYSPVLLATAMLHQVVKGNEAAPAHSAARWAMAASDAATKADRDRRSSAWALRGTAFLSFAGVVGVSVVVFVLVPRGFGANVLGTYHTPRAENAVSGFSNSVELGHSGFITQSQRTVLTMKMNSPGDRARLGRPVYLRGAVLDRYDPERARWRPAFRPSLLPTVQVQTLSPGALPPDRVLVTQEIELQPLAGQDGAPVVALHKPLGLTAASFLKVQHDPATGVMLLTETRSPSKGVAGMASARVYKVLSDPYAREDTVSDERRSKLRSWDAVFRGGEVERLARTILSERGLVADGEEWEQRDKTVFAGALRDYLRSRYEYTLEMTAPTGGRDPIEAFLFDFKRGHCEYFAAGLAALCKSVAIPARYVTGYLATEFDLRDGLYTVRESDAHAWVEVEVSPGVWREFDATPAEELPGAGGTAKSLAMMWRRFVAGLETAWSRGVVSYNQSDQIAKAGDESDPLGLYALVEQWIGKAKSKSAEQQSAQRAIELRAGFVLLLFAAGIVIVAARPLTRRVWRVVVENVLPGLRRFYSSRGSGDSGSSSLARLLTRELARRGFERPPAVPLLTYARDIRARDAQAGEAAAYIASILYSTRYGGESLPVETLSQARRMLRRLATDRPR